MLFNIIVSKIQFSSHSNGKLQTNDSVLQIENIKASLKKESSLLIKLIIQKFLELAPEISIPSGPPSGLLEKLLVQKSVGFNDKVQEIQSTILDLGPCSVSKETNSYLSTLFYFNLQKENQYHDFSIFWDKLDLSDISFKKNAGKSTMTIILPPIITEIENTEKIKIYPHIIIKESIVEEVNNCIPMTYISGGIDKMSFELSYSLVSYILKSLP